MVGRGKTEIFRTWPLVTGASKEIERSRERIEAKSLCKLFSLKSWKEETV